MKAFRYIPLFTFILIAYNIIVYATMDGVLILDKQLFSYPLLSGTVFVLNVKDLFMVMGIIVLYIEAIKATWVSSMAILDHALSLLVFVIFLVEFIVVGNAGNSTFLILTLMSLLDVIAGFTVSISTARRDIAVGKGE